ncbi:MAG: succinyl-diaminopimelate desuccinylase, partial [Candidatus Nanopelagicales bacterium]|jgi:succinyl-diaminopimelate desuccinylase|nr:succinyl-diaminopimelate desuccinylase [Candidatus Nanopelagicales bacterium]
VDNSPGAMPGLSHPAASAFLAATGSTARPKFGWTDVARFSGLGVPAVNFGPGDPSLAHTRGEYVPIDHLVRCEAQMMEWLG